MMGQGGVMDGMGAFGWLGMLITLLFWGGLLVLIIWAVVRIVTAIEHRHGTPPHTPQGHTQSESAGEILKQRYARGEIDTEEFEERRRMLREEENE
jgi:putative membrane protein